MNRSKILFASNPSPSQAAEMAADAALLIKQKLEVDVNLDPRKPMLIGDLVAACRGLELVHQFRARHGSPIGEIALFAVMSKEGDKPATYIGNEVRLVADGKVVAQRLRSPESAEEFRNAATGAARHAKSANLFLANWRDEGVLDRDLAKKLVVMALPSDMTAGVAYRVSWYAREHMVGTGRVDLRPALPAICQALDETEAKAKAEADAKTAAAKAVVGEIAHTAPSLRTVTFLRSEAKRLGLVGLSRATKAEIEEAIKAAAGLIQWQPAELIVTADHMKAISVAINMVDVGDDGEIRLKRALREAGIKVPLVTTVAGELAAPGAYKARLLAQAKACRVVETVGV